MGVERTLVFGIGFQIEKPICDESTPREILKDDTTDEHRLFKHVYKHSKYKLEEMGDDYAPDGTTYYIFIKYPFEKGYDLTLEVEKLKKYCSDMYLQTIGQFGLHGDLYIY